MFDIVPMEGGVTEWHPDVSVLASGDGNRIKINMDLTEAKAEDSQATEVGKDVGQRSDESRDDLPDLDLIIDVSDVKPNKPDTVREKDLLMNESHVQNQREVLVV